MSPFTHDPNSLTWQLNHELLSIEPCGTDGLRVRATRAAQWADLPGALVPQAEHPAVVEITPTGATIRNGKLQASVSAEGWLRFTRSDSGQVLLEEQPASPCSAGGRYLRAGAGGSQDHIEASFLARPEEHLYGLGQHPNGFLDQKGCVIDLAGSLRKGHVHIRTV